MKFSLVVATLGRYSELDILLQSLVEQTHKDFEVIIVDQNADIDLKPLVQKYEQSICLVYMHSDVKGLSTNRNKGLAVASGEVICFPDDDCHYFPDTLTTVSRAFSENQNLGFLVGKLIDFTGNHYNGSSALHGKGITYLNFFKNGNSATMFFKKSAAPNFSFDEHLGIGAKFGSGEDSDCILFLLAQKATGMQFPHIFIHHPKKYSKPSVTHIEKYATGFGAVMKKGVAQYKIYACLIIFIRYIGSAIIKTVIPWKSTHGRAYLRGYIRGFMQYD